MKKFIFISFLSGTIFIFGFLCRHYNWIPIDTVRNALYYTGLSKPAGLRISDYHHHRLELFELYNTQADVLMLGDSLIESAEWSILLPEIKLLNLGIDGDRTDSLLKRLDSALTAKPKKVVLMVGINDFLNKVTPSAAFENLKSITIKLKEYQTHIYLHKIIQPRTNDKKLFNNSVELNKLIEEHYRADTSVTIIDLNEHLTSDNALSTDYSRDGIHLNGKGYKVWASLLMQRL